MRLEKDVPFKRTNRNQNFLCNIRKHLLLIGIFVLITLGMYHYLSIKDHKATELLEETPEEHEVPIQKYQPLPYLTPEEQETYAMEKEFTRRREHVKEACENWRERAPAQRIKNKKPNVDVFFIIRRYSLVYCRVLKAASSSWFYIFNRLAGYTKEGLELSFHEMPPGQLARNMYPIPSMEQLGNALKNSLSFVIVRHPFDRLISVYRDKFLYHQNNTNYMRKGLEIIGCTRLSSDIELNSHETIDISELPPTFEEFIRYIVCAWKLGLTPDAHWTPISKTCSMCAVDFDFIIKFETLEKEQLMLLKKANLENIEPTWENKSPDPIGRTTRKNYFSQLSKQQISDLHQYFIHDFELFEYSADEYLAYGQEIHTSLPCRESPGVRPYRLTIPL